MLTECGILGLQELLANLKEDFMPDHDEIYRKRAEKYELLISKEDHQGNLMKVICEICSPDGLDVVDLGAGTGRLSCLLAPFAKSITAIDQSDEMLKVTRNKLNALGMMNWEAITGDIRETALPDHSIDLAVAGWSICYVGKTNAVNWQESIQTVMGELERVLRSNGTIILFETLGTGNEEPYVPENLIRYYDLLRNTYGFEQKVIRTDYRFNSVEQAAELSGFFFGEALANRVRESSSSTLPECTAVFWRYSEEYCK